MKVKDKCLQNKPTNLVSEVKKWVKQSLQCLPDYTEGEEKFLILEALNINLTNLVLLNEFDDKQLKKIKSFVDERLKGKPLNKISQRAHFYAQTFYVNEDVLTPRKETELLVEKTLQVVKQMSKQNLKILDLCCGSGAIGLSLAKNIKNCQVVLSDISTKAIDVAQKNRQLLNVESNTKILKSNLFEGLKKTGAFDIIVSNPPYIATAKIAALDEGVKKYDPMLALDGGEDGLKFYTEIAKSAKKYLNKEGVLLLEIGFDQATDVKKLLNDNGFNAQCFKDYSGLDRIIIASQN